MASNNKKIFFTNPLRLKPPDVVGDKTGWRLAIINIGSPCCGMNAAVRYLLTPIFSVFAQILNRSFVRNCIYSGNQPYGIHNGIDGLINDEVRPIEWSDVTGWVVEVK